MWMSSLCIGYVYYSHVLMFVFLLYAQEESGDRHTESESVQLGAKTTAVDETQTQPSATKFGWIQGVLVGNCSTFSSRCV